MAKIRLDQKRHEGSSQNTWFKRDQSGERRVVRDAKTYGTYKGRALPPPGRDHIVVLTPNPLPAPKSIDSE